MKYYAAAHIFNINQIWLKFNIHSKYDIPLLHINHHNNQCISNVRLQCRKKVSKHGSTNFNGENIRRSLYCSWKCVSIFPVCTYNWRIRITYIQTTSISTHLDLSLLTCLFYMPTSDQARSLVSFQENILRRLKEILYRPDIDPQWATDMLLLLLLLLLWLSLLV